MDAFYDLTCHPIIQPSTLLTAIFKVLMETVIFQNAMAYIITDLNSVPYFTFHYFHLLLIWFWGARVMICILTVLMF